MVRLITLTTTTLGLFLTALAVTAQAPGGGSSTAGQDKDIRSPLDLARTFCTLLDGHPDELSKILASVENTAGGGEGPGNGSPVNPVQYGYKQVKTACDKIKQQPEGSPSSSGGGSAAPGGL
ncbi:hypothetical protein LRAMOSA03161 [Lichtheimia ramosa]|uniref:Uncharacterized protein n=1 Tax=Lichtheimia ramosa TaxID=688394 RepID=A0A077WT52_9FUNG|nr:hypothetical protein LRAMOSA03161 [Lichtheimia ramosa]